MKISITKILSLSIILGIFINPVMIFAQEAPTQSMQASYADSQINAAISTIRSSGSMANTADGTANTSSRSNMSSSIGTNVAGCGAGQILANIISSSVTKAIGGTVNKVIDTVINVPVSEQGAVGENIKTCSGRYSCWYRWYISINIAWMGCCCILYS